MGKKLKLDIKDLKVQSFVTKLKKDERNKIKGGIAPTVVVNCTNFDVCNTIDPEETCAVLTDLLNVCN